MRNDDDWKTYAELCKEFIKEWLIVVSVAFFIWVFVAVIMQLFQCPNMTQTEVFFMLPKLVFKGQWQDCY